MSISDTGIDICDMVDTIVQSKLRGKNLQWSECSTFFASRDIYSDDEKRLTRTIQKK